MKLIIFVIWSSFIFILGSQNSVSGTTELRKEPKESDHHFIEPTVHTQQPLTKDIIDKAIQMALIILDFPDHFATFAEEQLHLSFFVIPSACWLGLYAASKVQDTRFTVGIAGAIIALLGGFLESSVPNQKSLEERKEFIKLRIKQILSFVIPLGCWLGLKSASCQLNTQLGTGIAVTTTGATSTALAWLLFQSERNKTISEPQKV